ncbi:MAG: hypothetical protein K0B87_09335 [Candidatus Syntrophosphaera sp.]|nr:hypothetical protein [Candidatus Syntrophosphaera sp.]
MKISALILALLAVCIFLSSAPLRDIPTELEQPDGSIYPCFMTGDEYYHRAHDANGYTIIQDHSTGWFVYAVKGDRELAPSPYIPGRDDPAAQGIPANLLPDASIIKQRFETFRGPGGDRYGRSPTTGTVNNITIFVRFSDQP